MDSANILIIEDNPQDSSDTSNILKEKGYLVSCAFNGKDGLKALREERFDLVILDLLLPDIKGEEICALIKKIRPLRRIPVIVTSIKDDADEIEELLSRGIDEYIIKPVRASYLINRVENLLKR